MPARFVDREFYRSSGRADWGKLLLGEAGTLFLAAVGAVLAFFVYHYVFHLVLIMPLAAGVILGVLGERTVERNHCRNRWVAAAGGFAAGCLFFFGTYYVELVWAFGRHAWTRIDVIPDLIFWHIQRDVIFGHFHPQRGPNAGPNAFLLAIEFLCVVVPAALIPFKSAGGIYCDVCEKWGESQTTTINFDAGEVVVAAIDQGQLADLPEFPTIEADVSKKNCPPCTRVTLEHCPDAAENGCPIYFSLRRFPKDRGRGRLRVKRLEIDQLEALRLMFKIPGLRGVDEGDFPDPSPTNSADGAADRSVG